jgi:polysaccharide biosynthesis protein PslG
MTKGRKLFARLLSLVLICVSALSCHASGAPKQAEIGMVLHYRGADATAIRRQFDLMSAMNVTWVKIDMDWSVVEGRPGEFDWAITDMFVDEAAAHQINVLGLVAFTPEWALPASAGDTDYPRHYRPEQLEDFANFARTAAERYASKGVRSWEIWNEPNIGKFWPPVQNAGEYGEMFRKAAAAIRGVDPEATVLIGGLTTTPDDPDPGFSPAEFLEQLYGNGTAQLADGIAAHPYSFPSLPMDAVQQREGGFADLPDLHAVMDDHDDGRKKIWITEFGAPTGTGGRAVSEEDQATALLQARQQVERWDWAGPIIYYELIDGGTDPSDTEQNFGVLREDLAPKAAAIDLLLAASRRHS